MNKKTLFIAEIGGNHQGDFAKARELVKSACNSKSDIIKFQLYSADGLVNESYDKQRFEHFQKFELSKAEYLELFDIVKNSKKKLCASVWDPKMFNWAIDKLDIIKVGSGDFTCLPLILELIEFDKPIILSTGLCNQQEVDIVLKSLIDKMGQCRFNKQIGILQCTSMYPIPEIEANLNVMNFFKQSYACKVGYSDHTIGLDALKLAISLSADYIEYHFSLNPADTSFRDNLVSLTPHEIDLIYLYAKKVSVLLGSSQKKPTITEITSNHVNSFRRGCYAKKNLIKGQQITKDDLVFKRPYLEGALSPLIFKSKFSSYVLSKDFEKNELIY
jgi:N,N'-diacetyllegionaminate synthase